MTDSGNIDSLSNTPTGHATRGSVRSTQKRKSVRSHSGCVTCRARKVKCDERPGVCSNCERLHLECRRADGTVAVPHSSQQDDAASTYSAQLGDTGVKRKRTYRSCTQCRASKSRCSGERPQCSRCTQRDLECEYDAEADPQWTRTVQSSSTTRSSNARNGTVAPDEDENHMSDIHESSAHEEPAHPFIPPPTRLSLPSPRLQDGSYSSELRPLIPAGNLSRSSSVFASANEDESDSMSWLFKAQLPSRARVRILVKEYFDNIHPLRCYAFIHRPSFIQRLDESSARDQERYALLHIVCALGAKFYALQYADTLAGFNSRTTLTAGKEWAKRAQAILFSDLESFSVQNLMVAVLLHEHELRVGNYAGAFMLTGIMTRIAQALQVNLEYSADLFRDEPSSGPSVCSKEARRRLMWSCYVADSLIGSGVDQLTLLNEKDIKIQLPCNERNFVLQVPCVTELLEEGKFLSFIPTEAIPPRVEDNMGIIALYIRLIRIRKGVLRYVKRLKTAQPPWLPESEFSSLDTALRNWYQQLPPSLQFTRAALYTRKESSQLGAFIILQCTYNWTVCDLYRIALPKLYRLQLSWNYPDDFLHKLRETIFIQARRCATIMADALRHGVKTLADNFLPAVAFDGNRVMLYYITQILNLNTEEGQIIATETLPYIRSNVQALKSMQSILAMAEALYPVAQDMISKVGIQSGSGPDSRSGFATGRQGNTPEPTIEAPVLSSTSNLMSRNTRVNDRPRTSPRTAAANLATAQQSPALSATSYYTTPGGAAATYRQQHLHMDPHGLTDLDSFFSNRFDANWQPSDTVGGAIFDGSLPPWIPPTDIVETVTTGFGGAGSGFMPTAMGLNFDSWPTASDVYGDAAGGGRGGPSAR